MSTGKPIELGEAGDAFHMNFHRFRGFVFLQGDSVTRLLIGNTVLPATVDDTQPFESESPYGGMVRLVAFTLSLVKLSRPSRLSGRHPRPFMKGLAEELRTGPAPVNPLLLTTAFRNGRDAGVALDRGCRGVPVSLSSEGSNQPWRHRRTCSGQG